MLFRSWQFVGWDQRRFAAQAHQKTSPLPDCQLSASAGGAGLSDCLGFLAQRSRHDNRFYRFNSYNRYKRTSVSSTICAQYSLQKTFTSIVPVVAIVATVCVARLVRMVAIVPRLTKNRVVAIVWRRFPSELSVSENKLRTRFRVRFASVRACVAT